jgi:hypothetical protein
VETGQASRIYTPGCSLNSQFLNGYKDAMPGGLPSFERGIAEVIDDGDTRPLMATSS